MERIKYTYIPSDNADDGMMQVLFSKDVVYTDMIIISNAARGVVIEPEIKDMFKVATEKNLDEVIKKTAINSECETIILNGFNISLDDVRNKYVDLAKMYDIYLCINTISDKVSKNVTVYFDYAITDLSDEEWEDTKTKANETIKEKLEEKKKEKKQDLGYSLLNAIMDYDHDKLESLNNIDDIDIKETYTYSNQDEEVTIHKLVDNSLIINDGNNEVLIGSKLINFLKTSLESLA